MRLGNSRQLCDCSGSRPNYVPRLRPTKCRRSRPDISSENLPIGYFPLTLNIGTGTGLSVLDVIQGFETATGLSIPYEVVARRPGDVPRLQACPRQAEAVLGWRARRGLEEMCRDGWAWQQANPMGYRSAA